VKPFKFAILIAFLTLPAWAKPAISANDQARLSLHLLSKGLVVAGVEELFKVDKPKNIMASYRAELQKQLPPQHPVWSIANIQWNSDWSEVFKEPTGSIVQSLQLEAPLNARNLKFAENLLNHTKRNSNERARLLWLSAHYYSINNKAEKAAPLLEELMKSQQSFIDQDLIVMTVARLYYQMNQLEKAISHYNLITKDSDYWVESVEERAWAYFRKGDYDRVQSDMKTLMNPMFANQVGPEPFFLDGFAKLKVCDYAGIFKTIKDFKNQFAKRIDVIDRLAKTGHNGQVSSALATLSNGPSTFEQVGKTVAQMPRFFYRDWPLARLAMRKAAFENEKSSARKHGISSWAQKLNGLESLAQNKIRERVKFLADAEINEARNILNKFHILEAEVIQRMHLQDRKSNKDLETQELAGDELEFPVTDDEVWADEVDKFQVTSRGCPQKLTVKNQEKTL